MATSVATNKSLTENKIEIWDHDPGVTTALITSPDGGTTIRTVDMANFSHITVAAMVTIPAAGALTLLEIVASETANMAAAINVKTSGVIAADAVGDWAALEASAQEIADLGARNGVNLRFAAARLTMSNAGAEAVVTHLAKPVYPRNGLTPATSIS